MSTISYRRQGSGDPVVLIHGIGHHGRVWGPLASLLVGQGYEVITIDLPGHGRSPAPAHPHTYSLASHAEQFEELFAELGIERPHVVGNSLGGLMGLHLAQRGSVRSLLALSPGGFYTVLGTAWAGAVLLTLYALSLSPAPIQRVAARSAWLRRAFMGVLYVHADRLTPGEFVADSLNLRRSRGFWRHVVPVAFARAPRDLAVPTTIAWGRRDLVLLPTQANRARRLVPGADHVWLDDCGHVPMLDDPQRVLGVAIQTFARTVVHDT